MRARLEGAERVEPNEVHSAWRHAAFWRAELAAVFTRVAVIALPTVGIYPSAVSEAMDYRYTELTLPINVAGVPSIAMPVPSRHPLPASLQLVGPMGSEEIWVTTARLIEEDAQP